MKNSIFHRRDLAALYGVATGSLNRAAKRNLARFPADFMIQFTQDEATVTTMIYANNLPAMLHHGVNTESAVSCA